ncbi:MAG: slipin family protein [Dehalococcoidales bacterium]|nr:slipin family protein [Dehalococcoidales bacterium]
MSTPIIIGIIALIIVVLIPSTVKILKEYERGVIFRLGRLLGTKGPGFFLIIPFVDQMTKRDLRVVTMDVTPQEVITKDNITVRVNAVIYFRVVNPEDSVVNVNDYIRATSQIAQTTLRNVLGQSELDELLTQREKLNLMLQKIIDEHTDPWGIKVATVEIKEVELPEQMRRMMAAQAEAERERRAKIIHAEGEFQASEKLAQAGAVIAREPVTLQLRYLQTLTEIAVEKNSTIIFPLPMDLIKMFMERGSGNKSGDSDSK